MYYDKGFNDGDGKDLPRDPGKIENTTPENCLDCENHKVIPDPDPTDWFNDDDIAVVCKITRNDNMNPESKYCSDRQGFRCVTSSCRPYNDRKESGRPSWCPLTNKTEIK